LRGLVIYREKENWVAFLDLLKQIDIEYTAVNHYNQPAIYQDQGMKYGGKKR
jgi:hypothetical protein